MILRLIRLELNIWRSLLFWSSATARREAGARPRVARSPQAGTHTERPRFPYARELAPLIGVFIFVSTIELVAVHLLLPWETVRLVLDIVSLWGLLWMVGLLASMKRLPARARRRMACDCATASTPTCGCRGTAIAERQSPPRQREDRQSASSSRATC